jgi:hypothetical protein
VESTHLTDWAASPHPFSVEIILQPIAAHVPRPVEVATAVIRKQDDLDVWPSVLFVPLGQREGIAVPGDGQNEPGLHGLQVALDALPVKFEYVPAGHFVG